MNWVEDVIKWVKWIILWIQFLRKKTIMLFHKYMNENKFFKRNTKNECLNVLSMGNESFMKLHNLKTSLHWMNHESCYEYDF